MVRWKDAAVQNTVLSAAELYFMARPDERVPWRQLLSLPPPPPPLPTDGHSPSVTPPPPEKWGARKHRSTKAAPKTAEVVLGKEAEEEKAPGRASPTTPLSWNACEFGAGVRDSCPTRKRPVVGGSVSNGGRRGGGGDGGRGGGGSVKMAAELKEWERSLLEKNKLLKKEVREQKLAQSMLLEENKRLKSLESKLHHQVVTETGMINAKSEETKHEECRLFPFDLNLPFPADSEVGTDCSGGCS